MWRDMCYKLNVANIEDVLSNTARGLYFFSLDKIQALQLAAICIIALIDLVTVTK